ncbi:hypothetical protein, partial [Shewanella baltica]|uniref:hypothetical protein n=1 Tax=Shewanella baltica TaxID=62322 RepID=UPI003D7BFEF2
AISKPTVVIFMVDPSSFLMSFSNYIVAHCEADLKWMGPFHYPWFGQHTSACGSVAKSRQHIPVLFELVRTA